MFESRGLVSVTYPCGTRARKSFFGGSRDSRGRRDGIANFRPVALERVYWKEKPAALAAGLEVGNPPRFLESMDRSRRKTGA